MARILLIDDDPTLAEMYQVAFRMHGFLVDLASNGWDGLKMIESQKPDLIVLDIMIPGMSGLEVLAQLKKQKPTQEIPVIVMTNAPQERYAGDTSKAGAAAYVIKSDTQPKELVELVRATLNGAQKEGLPVAKPGLAYQA
jgi:DNA-binding response OmpR family regulator